MIIRLDEDMHVHSTFSDGRDSLEDNLLAAVGRRLTRLGCVDHVRWDTTWVPSFVAAVRGLDAPPQLRVHACVEAKILDGSGHIDAPRALTGVDYVFVADHRFPFGGGCHHPRDIRRWIAGGADPGYLVDGFMRALHGALDLASRQGFAHKVVLAHLFSILPKAGLTDAWVSDAALAELAEHAAAVGASIEIDERWRCPSRRVARAFAAAGVPVLASTDAHTSDHIGRYDYVAQLAVQLLAVAA